MRHYFVLASCYIEIFLFYFFDAKQISQMPAVLQSEKMIVDLDLANEMMKQFVKMEVKQNYS